MLIIVLEDIKTDYSIDSGPAENSRVIIEDNPWCGETVGGGWEKKIEGHMSS